MEELYDNSSANVGTSNSSFTPITPLDFYPEIAHEPQRSTVDSDGNPNVGTSSSSEVFMPNPLESDGPCTSREVNLLFRYRKARTFDPSELAPARRTKSSDLPANWRRASQVQVDQVLGIRPWDKKLVDHSTAVKMHRSQINSGFFGRLVIKNTSEFLLTYRIRASVANRYRLTPPMGCIERSGEAEVYIETEQENSIESFAEINGDKFLIDVAVLIRKFVNLPSIYVFWRGKRSGPYRYGVGIVDAEIVDQPRSYRTLDSESEEERENNANIISSRDILKGRQKGLNINQVQIAVKGEVGQETGELIFQVPSWGMVIFYFLLLIAISVFYCSKNNLEIYSDYNLFSAFERKNRFVVPSKY